MRGRIPVERIEGFRSPALGDRRILEVFLPANFDPSGATRYPVLYLNDGQDSEALDLAGALDRLQAARELPPLLVVAAHATGHRIREYGTVGIANAQGYGDRAARYERFLLTELMPWIAARYPATENPAHTAIAGLSLGGLSAFDIAWRNPDRFAAVGVLSGSFWWRTDDRTPATRQASRIMHRRVRETDGRPPLRMWFETGAADETEDRDGNGVIDSIQDTDDLIEELVRKGYRWGRDIEHVTVPGGHNLPTWRGVLPRMLKWVSGWSGILLVAFTGLGHNLVAQSRAPAEGPVAARLRALVDAEEEYFNLYNWYTQEMASLRLPAPKAEEASVELLVTYAGPAGWVAIGWLKTAPAKQCVIYSGNPENLPDIPTTSQGTVARTPEAPACDD
jgi:enterochelin esterase-like enzyme